MGDIALLNVDVLRKLHLGIGGSEARWVPRTNSVNEWREFKLPLFVVKGKGPALLGRNWLGEIRLNWPMIKQLAPMNQRLEKVVQSYPLLFKEGLCTLQGVKAKIHGDPTTTPVFHKARQNRTGS